MMSIASACTRRSRDLKSSSVRGRRSPRRPSSTASANADGETIPGRVLAGGSEPRRSHRRVVDRQPTGCPAHVRGRASRCAPSTPTLAAFWATVHTKRRPPDPTSTASEVWSSRLLLGRRRRRNRSRVRGLAHGSWPSARKPEVNCRCFQHLLEPWRALAAADLANQNARHQAIWTCAGSEIARLRRQ